MYSGRGAEYFQRRQQAVQAAKARLLSAISAGSWQQIQAVMSSVIAPRLSAIPVSISTTGTTKTPAAAPKMAAATTTWLYVWSEINFYNGGLGGRQDSWPEGPDAINYCSTVDGVKSSLNGGVFDGPWSKTSCGGGRAWAGFSRSSPSRGTYKIEAFHRFLNEVTKQSYPPFTNWAGGSSPTPPATWYFDPNNGYDAYQTPVDFSLQVSAVQESGKPGHHVSPQNCPSPIIITAVFTPAIPSYNAPPPVAWSGGYAGSDNVHRNVACTNPANNVITASVGTSMSSSVTVHVADANAPGPAGQASLSYSSIGVPVINPGDFGLTVVSIGDQGVTAPTYTITPGFSGDRWTFRVANISHGYKLGIQSNLNTDLPQGNPQPFPIAPKLPPYWQNVTDAHAQARLDLDTSQLVPNTSTAVGPRRSYYWVEYITSAHEQAHVTHFYSPSFPYWNRYMRDFETYDVEATSLVYNCSDPTTTSGSAAVAKFRTNWDSAIANRHRSADQAEIATAEPYAHGQTNPMYVPIWSAIPVP